jgi:acyl-CoA thioesterase
MSVSAPSFIFDQDTRVERLEPGLYSGHVSDRWNIGPVPNGGYVLSIGMAALRQELSCPDPVSVTAHYLRPSLPDCAVRIEVETIKIGRQFTTAMVRLIQSGNETTRLLATYGDLGRSSGPIHVAGAPPPLPPREQLRALPRDNGPEFARRVEMLCPSLDFEPGHATGPAEVSGWIRFADGRMPDVHALGLMADSFPPAVFLVLARGWVPTIELTVHVRARPTSQWLRCLFRTRFLFGGLLEEDGEIWDESGTLVTLSRQLACAPRG